MTDLDIDPLTDPGHTPWYLQGNFGPVFDEVTDVNLRPPLPRSVDGATEVLAGLVRAFRARLER